MVGEGLSGKSENRCFNDNRSLALEGERRCLLTPLKVSPSRLNSHRVGVTTVALASSTKLSQTPPSCNSGILRFAFNVLTVGVCRERALDSLVNGGRLGNSDAELDERRVVPDMGTRLDLRGGRATDGMGGGLSEGVRLDEGRGWGAPMD